MSLIVSSNTMAYPPDPKGTEYLSPHRYPDEKPPLPPTTESSKSKSSWKADGVCYAGEAKDVTVHLELGLRDDLTDELEELWRLARLGHFRAAREYFAERLEPYSNHPFVLVEYADILFRQGDFDSLSRLVSEPLPNPGATSTNPRIDVALNRQWSMTKIYTIAHGRDAPITLSDVECVQETLRDLASAVSEKDRPISSTDVSTNEPNAYY